LHLLAALDTPTRGSVTLAGVVTVQALVLGVAGGALGVALTPPAVAGLNAVANAVVGFETLVRTPRWIYGVGFAIAVVVSALGAAAAGLRIASLNALEQLR
jgi:putative ABC transport system permease protein